MVIPNIQKLLEKSLCWVIEWIVDHTIIISKHKPLSSSSYIKWPKELDNVKTGWIIIQSIDDNDCFKLHLVRYLHPEDENPATKRKSEKHFARKLDFKDMTFPVKVRDIYKIEI